ncbi:hypothetical protein [Campylobacter ureolyticus]|uniref:Lipoprotein n=1 Tax=Campylobacter ureolyticus TaxID=827 RepID=A0AAE7JQ79_9BACT|nr:hypothetical protein [Campylobacter ureolyticus]MCR8685287.1 hypothetical protein [Campylobacter ureolyticus]QKF85167.1 hypothetical protein CURT_1750 [Campylobacter ureolyticus]QQY36354.1 hypothetical protein I6I59_03720 [Campylobacter ureolyticus]SUX25445.1 Uncharacterised protein [Campylobacter ureolyticus]
MKKLVISLLILSGFFAGCSQTAEYNKNLEVKDTSHNIAVKKPLQKTYIYMDASALGSQSIKSSTSLGEDNLKIDIGEFVKNESLNFFKRAFSNLEFSTNKEILSSNDLIVMPEIYRFGYGFYSADGFNVDSKPFVNYTLNLKIYKNGMEIYNKVISKSDRIYGEKTFFGMGNTSYAQIGPIFQKALANDYSNNAVDILKAINLAN